MTYPEPYLAWCVGATPVKTISVPVSPFAVDAAARALSDNWEALSEDFQDTYRDDAKAVIEAYLEHMKGTRA